MSAPCCPPGSHGAGAASETERCGKFIEIGGRKAYLTGENAEGKLIILIHDIFGFETSRHLEIADWIAKNGGYKVIVPDFFAGEPWNEKWDIMSVWGIIKNLAWFMPWVKKYNEKTIPVYVNEHLFPWIEAQEPKITMVGWHGLCWGAYAGCFVSGNDKNGLIRCATSAHPSILSVAPYAGKASIPDLIKMMKHPVLFLSAGGDPAGVKEGGEIQKIMAANGQKLECVEFPEMKHGWSNRGDLKDPIIKRDVDKAHALVLEFFQKHLN